MAEVGTKQDAQGSHLDEQLWWKHSPSQGFLRRLQPGARGESGRPVEIREFRKEVCTGDVVWAAISYNTISMET